MASPRARYARSIVRSLGLASAFTVLLITASVAAADPPDGVPIVTRHQARIHGNELSYTAEVARIAIRDVETGEPHGYMFYAAYRLAPGAGAQPSTGAKRRGAAVDQHGPKAERPIMFIWNGGPGSPSDMLHFHAAGPKVLRGMPTPRLADNPDSWLSAADLVMVDPVGTGFSRPSRPQYAQEFYNTRGDVASVAEFVRCWLILHDAVGAPVFLAGESWGAGRAASVAYALQKRGIEVNGLVLISGGFGLDKQYGAPVLLKALDVVDMASTALYWHRTAPDLGGDPAIVRRKAEDWVRSTYVPALAHIGKLTAAERDRIAAQLARFTGIAPGLIDRRTLLITPHQFRTELLKSQGKVLYLLDGRRTSPPPNEGAPLILHYLREMLGYRTDLPYLGIDDLTQGFAPSGVYPKSAGEQWNYATAPMTPEQIKAAIAAAVASGAGPPQLGPPLPGTREALARNPKLRVLVAVGMYDPYDQCARGEQTESSLPPQLRRAITFKCYPGGHAMYLGSSAIRAELSHDVEALIESAR